MKKKMASTVGILTLCASLAMPVYAAADTVGNQGWHHDNSISGFTNYEEMKKQLQKIEKSSQGNVVVEVVGQSNRGRDIYKATVGTGKKSYSSKVKSTGMKKRVLKRLLTCSSRLVLVIHPKSGKFVKK